MQPSIAILCAGGPAPGINTVVSTIAKVFLKDGYRVIGIQDGYKNLFNGKAVTVDMDFLYADRIFSRGGSVLRMSRAKPKDHEFTTDFFVENNVKLLVTVGGDDTASTANRLAKYLQGQSLDIKNIHVPKTIDNDLPLPGGMPTFGFNSAKDEAVKIGNTVYEDARTSDTWFVVSTMGRSAGHLAFEVGVSCHFPVIIIPEMFNKTEISFDKIINLMISSILKRTIDGISYGVAVIGEGVFHFLSDEQINNSGINFTYDEHGHPELGNVSKAHIFNILLQQRLKELKIETKSRPVELGYELRCCTPVAFDLTYCTQLGLGVRQLFNQGDSGCIVSVNSMGEIKPLFLKDIEDASGKIPPRLVDMNSGLAKLAFSDMHVITPADYEAAKAYVEHPEEFDFCSILNWDFNPASMLRT